MSHILDMPVCYPIINYYNIGESLFILFASLTYGYHYLMMLIKLYNELEIVQTAQLNQLFELLHLVHIYDHGFFELGRKM